MKTLHKSGLGVENSVIVSTILSVAGQLKNTFDDALEESGLNYNSYRILVALGNATDGKADISELAELTGLQVSRAARLGKLLIDLQYASVNDNSPILKFVLQLTPKGQQAIAQLSNIDMLMDYSFASINEVEKVEMLQLLNKVNAPWILKTVG